MILKPLIRITPILFSVLFFCNIDTSLGNDRKQPFKDTSGYDVHCYHIQLNVSDKSTYLSGRTIVYGSIIEPDIQKIDLELSASLIIDSIVYNNKTATFKRDIDCVSIDLDHAKDTSFKLDFYYHGTPLQTSEFGGIRNQFVSNSLKLVTYSLSEPFFAKDWFPCKQ